MSTAQRLAVAALAVLLPACSGKIIVKEIGNDLTPGTAVEGIPFRSAKRFTVKIYEKSGADTYAFVDEKQVTLADPTRLFLLGFQSDPLANPTFDVILNADNTIQQVALKTESKAQSALNALTGQVTALTTAETERRTTSTTNATAAANAAIAADKAKQAADVASLEYQVLQATANASALDLLKAEQKERAAKIAANEAARLAGKPPYFPDVSP